MATIDKQANGSVKITRNSQIVYLNNLDNVSVTTEGSTDGNPIVIIAYEGGQQVFSISEITSINGSPKPATAAATVELLALSVFKFGGGSGVGATVDNGDTFTVLDSNVWDRSLYANAERTLSADETLSIINDTKPFSYGVLYVTANGHTLTLPGTPTGIIFNYTGETTLVYNKRSGIYRWTSNGIPRVETAPVITLQPIDENISEDDQLSISVDYDAYPSATVQWQKSTDGGNNFTNVAGATSKIFAKTGEVADTGKYRAVVSNSEGSVTSLVVDVVVAAVVDSSLQYLTVANSTGVDLSQAPLYYEATNRTGADNINPVTFTQTLGAGANGIICFAVSPAANPSADTRHVYFGFSELAAPADPANVQVSMKVGLFVAGRNALRVKDNDGFWNGSEGDRTPTASASSTRYGIKRTGGVYTVVQSFDYGATFETIYTFVNYSFTGKLYVTAGIVDGGFDSALTYPSGGGLS